MVKILPLNITNPEHKVCVFFTVLGSSISFPEGQHSPVMALRKIGTGPYARFYGGAGIVVSLRLACLPRQCHVDDDSDLVGWFSRRRPKGGSDG